MSGKKRDKAGETADSFREGLERAIRSVEGIVFRMVNTIPDMKALKFLVRSLPGEMLELLRASCEAEQDRRRAK